MKRLILSLLLLAAPLHAQTTATSVKLLWTAPGDDGMTGRASYYDMRYSLAPITFGNFPSATRWNGTPTTPALSGAADSTTVTGLAPSTQYYFCLKACDEAGNCSNPSNVVPWITGAPPDVVPPGAPTGLRVKP